MPSHMFTHPPALPQLPAAAGAPRQKMKLTKLWGMKGNAHKGWSRDHIPGSAGAPFPFRHLVPPPPQITGRSAYKAYVSSYTQENT